MGKTRSVGFHVSKLSAKHGSILIQFWANLKSLLLFSFQLTIFMILCSPLQHPHFVVVWLERLLQQQKSVLAYTLFTLRNLLSLVTEVFRLQVREQGAEGKWKHENKGFQGVIIDRRKDERKSELTWSLSSESESLCKQSIGESAASERAASESAVSVIVSTV